MEYLVKDHPHVAAKGPFPREQEVEDNAQTVDIAASIHGVRFAAGLLWTHVRWRSQHLALDRNGDFASIALRKPEVHDVWLAILTDHNVRRLHIPVNDPAFMGELQGVGHRSD